MCGWKPRYFVMNQVEFLNQYFRNCRTRFILYPCTEKDELKEFLSIEKLICKLKDASPNPLQFSTDEEKLAVDFFRYTNYYSFAIYRKQLYPYKNDKAGDRYSFTDCLSLYDFDSYLREKLNHFTGIIECFMKATFVSSICSWYSGSLRKAEFYLDIDIYRSNKSYRTAISILENVVENNKSLIFDYHKKNKNNKFPIWVLIEELTFGEASKLISTFKKEIIDEWITSSFLLANSGRIEVYDDNIRSSMFGWFQSVWHIRNVCAHYSRIYGALFKVANPAISAEDKKVLKKNQQFNYVKQNQLLAYLLAFKNILCYHSSDVREEWNRFIYDLGDKIVDSEQIQPNQIGFIDNWEDYLIIP